MISLTMSPKKGTLNIYRDHSRLNKSVNNHQNIFSSNKEFTVLDNEELVELEPQLNPIKMVSRWNSFSK